MPLGMRGCKSLLLPEPPVALLDAVSATHWQQGLHLPHPHAQSIARAYRGACTALAAHGLHTRTGICTHSWARAWRAGALSTPPPHTHIWPAHMCRPNQKSCLPACTPVLPPALLLVPARATGAGSAAALLGNGGLITPIWTQSQLFPRNRGLLTLWLLF